MDAAKVHPLMVEAQLSDLLEILGAEPSKTQATTKKAVQMWSTFKEKLPLDRG